MYFLKKLTNFAKGTNGREDEGSNSSPENIIYTDESGRRGENLESLVTDEVNGNWPGMGLSSNSSSNPSIPDCFFDDLPETSSSGNSEANSSDSDSKDEMTPTAAGEVADARSNSGPLTMPKKASLNKILLFDESRKLAKEADIAALIQFCSDEEIILDVHDDKIVSSGALNLLMNKREDVEVELLAMDYQSSAKPQEKSPNEANNVQQALRYAIADFLNQENDRAEARLAARRQARVEAREIRLRELERQQKEQEENADRAFDMSYAGDSILRTGRVTPSVSSLNPRDRSLGTSNSYHSSRRSSEDSIEEGLTLRDIRHELKEAEEKFKKAMIANAQLDNEKSALAYQVELLKDRFEDLEETHAQLGREHRDKCREHEQLKRAALKLKEDLEYFKTNLLERDRLISEYGLVIVDCDEDGDGTPKRTLVSAESADLLKQAGSGTLDVRLKKFSDERNELLDEIRHLKLELEEERSKRLSDSRSGCGSLTNGPLDEETSKILSDYKFKLQKAEQDVSTLQANVARLESQVIRYKTAAESSEKAEDELKIEKRKLQRENRESIARIEELETANSHLQRRMDKLKNAKSTLLKEL